MDDQKIAEMREYIEDLKERVEAREAAARLCKNRDFKKLVTQAFCKDECARYAKMSSNMALKPEDRADALATAQAAGYFERFMNAQLRMGDRAEGELGQAEAMLRNLEAGVEPESEQEA